jgi:DNA processing protein
MNVDISPEWHSWYRLSFNYGLSFTQKMALLKRFSLPEHIFAASHKELAEVVGELSLASMEEHSPRTEQGLVACEHWLSKSVQHHLLCLSDEAFPKGLLDLSDPPLLLFAQGDLSALKVPSLAVVGSRSASPQGLENALAFSKAIGRAGYGVVSGLALGIDTAAHEGALAAGAPTIAVVGTGIDRVYPARNHALARRIAAQGLLMSEFELEAPPLPQHFPRRNRLIAALAKGVLVVEAARQSGSLITAKFALDIGREVFAIPGSIHSPVSKGCHQLLRQGAKLVESGEDITEELEPMLVDSTLPLWASQSPGATSSLPASLASLPQRSGVFVSVSGDEDEPILRAMGFDPMSLLDIIRLSKLPSERVQTRLLELELLGQISRLDDGRLLQIVEAT